MSEEQYSLDEKLNEAVEKKIQLLEVSPTRYFARAMLAGLFLTLATTLACLVAEHIENFIFLIAPTTTSNNIAYNLSKIFFAFTFSWALVIIIFMHGELFTSNVMYFSGKASDKTVRKRKAIKVLVVCYIANFVGAVLSAAFIVLSGTFSDNVGHFAEHIVFARLAKDPLTIFLQGILANLIVNIAIMLGMNLRDDLAKITAILFAVFMFTFFGSEHVIANFSSFSLVGFSTGFQNMEVMAILKNFFFATLGNIIGGGVLIGITYVWLNHGDFKYKD